MPKTMVSRDNAPAISIDRRSFISGIAAAGLGALASSRVRHLTSVFAQTPMVAKSRLIDVHHHFVPPFYLSHNRDHIAAAAGGRMPGHPDLAGFPELSLALKTEKGVVLITGCSHSTVEGIIRATKQYLGSNIDLVEGGFHLFPYDGNYISNLAKQMKDELGVRRVAPAHCTGNLAFKIFPRPVWRELQLRGA